MLSPALLVLAAVSIFPFIYIIAMSFSLVQMIGGISFSWVGLDNWTRLFSDGAVWESWLRSVVFFVLSVGLQMTFGIAIALAIYETRRGRNTITSLVLMPMFMAPVIVGLLGRFLTDSTYGLYAWALDQIGLYNGDILGNPTSAFLAVTLMDVWEWTPLIALIVLAGLTSMPKPGARSRRDGRRELLVAAARHRAADDLGRDHRRAADPLDGRDPLLRHHHQHDQRRSRGRDQDRADPAVRDGVPLLRPGLRRCHRAVDARGHDPDGQPVHADPQAKGLAK